ncbi:MAG: hypothetical protein KF905_15900 [Flavobacteriales bacterium]|nr:hypothetical protein [Flavobacteriales bacterium]
MRRIQWSKHGIEFLVIVFGIMVSFLLNEWRQERNERIQEQRLLADLRDDLRNDSAAFAQEMRDLELILSSIARLKQHSETPIPADSVLRFLGPPLSYVGISAQDVTYQAMKSTGSVALVRDKDLLRDIFSLYGYRYFMLREAADIDKRMVLDHMLPLVNERFLLRTADGAVMDRLMADTNWQNLIDFSEFHKTRILELLRKEQAHIELLITRIGHQLNT